MIGTRITIIGDRAADDLQRIAKAWNAIFPAAGSYWVEMLKAAPAAEGVHFDEWFLELLSRKAGAEYDTMRNRMWELLDGWITERGFVPSETEWWELGQVLFDLSRGSTAHMVGLTLPPELSRRLHDIGFTAAERLDFPALAYRMGKLYRYLVAKPAGPWEGLVELAGRYPLSPAEEMAIAVARKRAGIYLKPVFDEAGRIWTADREIRPLRQLLAEAGRRRLHPREVSRSLGATARAQGNLRDMERVARTEIADMRSRGSWKVERQTWPEDAQVYRHTSTTACDDCVRLYKDEDGMPRLYALADLEASDRLGPNAGPHESWVAKIGPTHPNCACSPWQRWFKELEAIMRPGAVGYAERVATAA